MDDRVVYAARIHNLEWRDKLEDLRVDTLIEVEKEMRHKYYYIDWSIDHWISDFTARILIT